MKASYDKIKQIKTTNQIKISNPIFLGDKKWIFTKLYNAF